MRERSTDGGDIAHAYVGKGPERARNHRPAFSDLGGALERAEGGQGAYAQAVSGFDSIQTQSSKADQALWPQHASLHHEHQRRAAGERPRAFVVDERQGLAETGWLQ
jgi:hypothetical protein